MSTMARLRLLPDHVTALKHMECIGGQPNLVAYQCGAREWTYAYGRKRGVREGMTCTPHEAELMLQEDIEENQLAIMRLFPGRIFNRNEMASMVFFLHNFGEDKFKSYTLYELIRDEAPEEEIRAQWLKYQYTIRDDDADGDLDAVIDRGLPIRRYRELLIRAGYSWDIARAAANENNLDLREEQVEWKNGGYKERLISRTPFEDVLRRAESLREFEAEDDEEELFAESSVSIPEPASEPSVESLPESPKPEPKPVSTLPLEEPKKVALGKMPPPLPPSPTGYGKIDPGAPPKEWWQSRREWGRIIQLMTLSVGAERVTNTQAVAAAEIGGLAIVVIIGWVIMKWGERNATRYTK